MSAIFTVTALPLGILLIGVLLLTAIFDWVEGYSALLGGLAVILPNMIFVWLAFRHGGASNARNIVNAFYVGETIKLSFVALWIGLVFWQVDPVSPASLFVAFIVTQAASMVAATRLHARLPTRRI